jgi:hypothetical protein
MKVPRIYIKHVYTKVPHILKLRNLDYFQAIKEDE